MKFKNIEILQSIAFFMCEIPLLYWKVNKVTSVTVFKTTVSWRELLSC